MKKKLNSHFLFGILFLILSQTMVGVNIVSSKLLLSTFPILILLGIRFSLATIILFPLHWLSPARKISIRAHFSTVTRKDLFFIVAQALTAGVLFNCIMLFGLHNTDANIAGIITSALPAIIALMSWLMLKEKISMKNGLCIFLASIGLGIIACNKVSSIGAAHSFFGDFFILLSLLPEATYYILCRLRPLNFPIFLISSLMNAINAIILLPFLLGFDWGTINITLGNCGLLFILGLAAGLFFVFWFLGCQRVNGVITSLSTVTMPIATVFLAWAFLGESLTYFQTVGMAIVILSIIVYAKC